MPELPEVENIRKGLLMSIKGKKIKNVSVYYSKIIENPDVETFKSKLIGQELHSVERRGKFLIFKWTDFDMVSHLRMEGRYHFFCINIQDKKKHTHVILKFTDNTELHYSDSRKFGRIALLEKDSSLISYKGILKLGPEPMYNTFDLKNFELKLKKTSKQIKPLLLEQSIVAGLGNIYVDEVLWISKIHPRTIAKSLNNEKIFLLRKNIIRIIDNAISAGGTTIRSYTNLKNKQGNFQKNLFVYGRNGLPCFRCGIKILKEKISQRGTHFCPSCQSRKNI